MNLHQKYIKECLKISKKARGDTLPNPMVGCVIVRDGKIIAKGIHKAAGEFHAERVALLKAGKRAKGADLYVNLQPCSHHGKTPPCTDIIISSGIKRVFYGVKDPNPVSCKRSDEILRQANIDVFPDILAEECCVHNREFFTNQIRKRTFVFGKWAQTIDGKIADFRSRAEYISSEKTRRLVHRLRYRADAILVGIETVLNSDPMLNIRYIKKNKSLIRIVLDSHGRIPEDARLVQTAKEYPFILVSSSLKADKRNMFREKGVIMIEHDPYDLEGLLQILYKDYSICSLMVEGGGLITGSFHRHRLMDEYNVILAPKIAGDNNDFSCVRVGTPVRIENFSELALWKLKRYGDEVYLRYFSEDIVCLPDS